MRKAFWCVARTVEGAGLHVLPYRFALPTLGSLGVVLFGRSEVAAPSAPPAGLAYLDGDTLRELFHFPGDEAAVAVEENLGAKYGLDLKAIYAGRIRPQQLLATGEVPIVLATATGTITSHILGVKDHVLVATITNKVGTSIFARSDIKSIEDLKGKTIATGRPGAFLDATVRYVLRS